MRDAHYRESVSCTVYKFSPTSSTRTHDTMLLKPRLPTTSKNLNSLSSAPSLMSHASRVLCMAPICVGVEDGVEIIYLISLLSFLIKSKMHIVGEHLHFPICKTLIIEGVSPLYMHQMVQKFSPTSPTRSNAH
jgi:hypothetical protein